MYSGGIGSYALLVMVAAFLLLHPSRLEPDVAHEHAEANLGILLLDFFRLYGRSLNAAEVGVSCRCARLAAAGGRMLRVVMRRRLPFGATETMRR